MDLLVVGKHTEIDARLRALTEEKVTRIEKFANDVRRVDVEYGELAHAQSRRLAYVRDPRAPQSAPREGFGDRRRASRRARPRGREGGAADATPARSPGAPRVTAPRGTRPPVVDEDDGGESEDDGAGPAIVKIKQFEVKPMTAEEAALQMEMLSHDFFLFRSTETGHAAVVYRRRDGAFGLIEVTG